MRIDWSWFGRVGGIVVQAFGVIGVLLLALQIYLSTMSERRIAGFDSISLFFSEYFMVQKSIIREKIVGLNLTEDIAPKLTDKTVQAVVDKIVQNGRSSGDLEFEMAVYNVIAYFDLLYSCVQAEICDRPAVMSVHGEFLRDFRNMFGGYILKDRKITNDEGFGRGVLEFDNTGSR